MRTFAIAPLISALLSGCVLGPNAPKAEQTDADAGVAPGDSLATQLLLPRVSRVFRVGGGVYLVQRPPNEGDPFRIQRLGDDGKLTPLPVEGMPVRTSASGPESSGAEMRSPTAMYGSEDGSLWLATTNAASSFGGPARVYRLQQDKMGAIADSWECVSGCHDKDTETAWASRFGSVPFKGSPRFLRLGMEGSGNLLAICNKEEPNCQYYMLPSPLPANASTLLEKAKPLGRWTTADQLADGSILLGMTESPTLGTSRLMLVTPKSSRTWSLPRAGLTGVQAHSAERVLLRMSEQAMLLDGGELHHVALPTMQSVSEACYLDAHGTLWAIDETGTFFRRQSDRSWQRLGLVHAAGPGSRILGANGDALWVLVPKGPTDDLLQVSLQSQ